MALNIIFFFFSSRRRHTRWNCDWSSDVCSSDLIDVDVIVQNIGHDGMTDLSFTVHRSDYAKAMKLLKNQVQPYIKCRDVTGDDRIAKVSIVGMGMRSHAGIAAQMFRTLAEEGINIQMISTSEIKITVVIEEKYTELAVRVLHKAFELDQE